MPPHVVDESGEQAYYFSLSGSSGLRSMFTSFVINTAPMYVTSSMQAVSMRNIPKRSSARSTYSISIITDTIITDKNQKTAPPINPVNPYMNREGFY